MIQIYTARIHYDCPHKHIDCTGQRRFAFTLIESMTAVFIVSLLVLVATINFSGMLAKNSFKAKIQELVSTMQMAANAAAESSKRYEVIINLDRQNYMLREITSTDLSQVLDEEIIVDNNLSKNCWFAYVLFDDGDYTNQGQAKFRVGHSGWQFGGKIVLLDENDQPYSIIVNRLNRIIELKQGDVGFLTPKTPDEIAF